MGKQYSLLSIAVAIFGITFTACNDAEYGIKDNSVYIAEAATTANSTVVSMEAVGTDVNVTIRLSKQVDYDVKVEVSLNPDLLDQFNDANSTSYLLLPSDHFQWTDKTIITIPAGEIGATLKIHVDNFDTQGKRYALPVVLNNVIQGDVSKSASQSQFVYVIAKPLITSVPVMKAVDGVGVRAAPTTKWEITTPQWSIEMWVRMSGYTKNNQAIFDNAGGDNEIYIRFGDANAPYNYLQIKFNGDGGKQTERDLVAGVWYHWAFVYDGSVFTLYRNGEEDFKFDPPALGDVHINGAAWISSGITYFPDQCAMSQLRFWKTAITQTQIKNNMYYEVDPTNPNLIAYWPMNEGSGDVFKDVTGNGHDATASVTSANAHTIQRWEHDVRFDK